MGQISNDNVPRSEIEADEQAGNFRVVDNLFGEALDAGLSLQQAISLEQMLAEFGENLFEDGAYPLPRKKHNP